MKQLTLEEIKSAEKKMFSLHYLDNTLLRDWTQFVFKAATSGVSDFEIDQFILSDEDFEEKYEKGENYELIKKLEGLGFARTGENTVELVRETEVIEKKLTHFQKIISLAGYSQNGTNITISFFADDTTDKIILSGENYGKALWNVVEDSLEKAIDVAYEKYDQKIGIIPNVKDETSFKKLKELAGAVQNGSDICVSFFEDEDTHDFTVYGRSMGEKLWSVSNTNLEKAIAEAYEKYGSED